MAERMKTEDTYQPRPITAIMDEAREEFKKAYGRLLTEEEAIKLTDEIREALREEGEL